MWEQEQGKGADAHVTPACAVCSLSLLSLWLQGVISDLLMNRVDMSLLVVTKV